MSSSRKDSPLVQEIAEPFSPDARERKRGTPPQELTLIALRKTAADCRDAKLLCDFWENLTMEDMRMIGTEWDWNTALAVRAEESREEGQEEGIGLGIRQNQIEILELINQGYTLEQLKERLSAGTGNSRTV